MSRVALIGLPTMMEKGGTFPPLTLTHLATVLKKRIGNNLKLESIDLQLSFVTGELGMDQKDLHERLLDIIKPENHDIVMFATMCNNLPLAINIAAGCKAGNPDMITVIGGTHATLVAESIIIAFEAIDVVVMGEGEETVVELVEAYGAGAGLSGVRGIAIRDGADTLVTAKREYIKDLDKLPFPDFSLVHPLEKYQPNAGWGNYSSFIDVGRGCPYKCTFCSTTLMWGGKYRQKSAHKICEMMKHLHDEYGIGHFIFNHDEFTANRKRVLQLCHSMIDSGMNTYSWMMFCRIDHLDESLVSALVEAGCSGIFLGVESGYSDRLKKLNKRLPLEKVKRIGTSLIENNVECMASIILGFPDETIEEVNITLNMALQLSQLGFRVSLQLLTPHPSTVMYRQYVGSMSLNEATFPFYDNSEFISDREKELIRNHPDIFTVFYNYDTVNIPFMTLFNLYHDYKRLLAGFTEDLCGMFQSGEPDMVGIHAKWRKYLADKHGVEVDRVIDDDELAEFFSFFLRRRVCK